MKQVMIDYIFKNIFSHVELYFPYCVAYYDDIIKISAGILYISILVFYILVIMLHNCRFGIDTPSGLEKQLKVPNMEGWTGNSIRWTGTVLSCSNSVHISKWLLKKKIIVRY